VALLDSMPQKPKTIHWPDLEVTGLPWCAVICRGPVALLRGASPQISTDSSHLWLLSAVGHQHSFACSLPMIAQVMPSN
jgi:hypothetical protein